MVPISLSQRPFRWGGCAALLALITCLAAPVAAQQVNSGLPQPRLLTVVPPGAKAGTTVEVTLTGIDIEAPEKLVFSHPTIKSEPIETTVAPPDPKNPKRGQRNKATVISKFKVTIPADVPLGNHDVRMINEWGISNPRTFVIGDLPEVLEKEPNSDVDQAQRVTLNTTVNGSLTNQVDVDYYQFTAKKGQRVVFSCLASSIDSRFDPEMKIYSMQNKLVASNVSRYNDNDVVLDCVIPADGDYLVRLCEFTHTQGNAEHFYRLTISTGPWIDAVYPPAIEPGKAAQVTLYGRNLPGGQKDPTAVTIEGEVLEKATVTITAPADPVARTQLAYTGHIPPAMTALDGFEYRLRTPNGVSNPIFIKFAQAPVVLDNEKNKTVETAQEITLPCEIAGRIEKPGDLDWYTFSAKKGEIYFIDLVSDRMGAVGDMYFILKSAASKGTIAEQDDTTDTLGNKFFAFSQDPAPYRFVVPADGKYQLLVSSRTATSQSGPRNLYTVRISHEEPDFRLVAVAADSKRPDAGTVYAGGSQFFSVFAWRRDGFNEDIALTVEGLPPGVTCPPQTLAGSMKHGLLVLNGAPDAKVWTGDIKIKGTATIKGKSVVREARAGSITWPLQQGQNAPAVARMDRALPLAVRGKPPFNLVAKIDNGMIPQGGKATVSVKLGRLWPECKTPVQIQNQQTLQGMTPYLPQGLTIQGITLNPGKDDGTLTVNVSNNTPPGTYNLVLYGQTQFPWNKDPMAKQKQNTPFILPSTPVTVVVLPKNLATVALTTPKTNVQKGMQTEVVVKVTRLFDYNGPFKVELVPPSGVKDVNAAAVTIPAGQNEAKLLVGVGGNATPGARSNLVVKVTAMFADKVPVVQEAKFNLNVVK